VRKIHALPIAGAIAGLVLAVGVPQVAAATTDNAAAVSSVYCQTANYDSYFKLFLHGVITPGGGPLCYDGHGTITLNRTNVVKVDSGAHSGQFTYRIPPSDLVRTFAFTPGQTVSFPQGVQVLSLTLR
jgi:hypothetical protein